MGTSISSLIDVTTASLGVLPGPATGLQVSSVTATSIILSWTAPVVGTTPFEFQVQQQLVVGGAGWINDGGVTTATSEQIIGLLSNTAYQFQVITLNSTGDTTSAVALATTSSLAPNAPTGVALSGSTGPTSATIQWQAPSSGSAPFTYQVYAASPSGSGSFSQIGPATTALSETLTGLVSGNSYDFYVLASNGAGSGTPSAVLSNVQTATGGVPPSAPQNLTAGAITTTSIAVSWTAPATGTPPLSYTVQYRLAS